MQARAFNNLVVPVVIASWLAGIVLAGSIPGPTADVARFAIPGALLAWTSMRLPADSSMARIGRWLLLFSALAFAAQGLFAFDPADPDAYASRMRALAWMLWWLAFAPGALLSAALRGRIPFIASAIAVVLVCMPALLPVPRAVAVPAQSVAALAWFAWWWFAAARRTSLSRGAA
jgi:hypothetical protein